MTEIVTENVSKNVTKLATKNDKNIIDNKVPFIHLIFAPMTSTVCDGIVRMKTVFLEYEMKFLILNS